MIYFHFYRIPQIQLLQPLAMTTEQQYPSGYTFRLCFGYFEYEDYLTHEEKQCDLYIDGEYGECGEDTFDFQLYTIQPHYYHQCLFYWEDDAFSECYDDLEFCNQLRNLHVDFAHINQLMQDTMFTNIFRARKPTVLTVGW